MLRGLFSSSETVMEVGAIVRLKAPKHKNTLEDEWYCRHWPALTPMVYLGARGGSPGFGRVMTPDDGVKTIWCDYLTTRMRRGVRGA